MEKIKLIIQREYLTRVKKRSFLVTTLLAPIGLFALMAFGSLISSYGGDETKRIAVLDEAGVITGGLKDEDDIRFVKAAGTLDALKDDVRAGTYDAVLRVPEIADVYDDEVKVYYYSDDELSLAVEGVVRNRVRDYVREYKATTMGIDERSLGALRFDTTVDPEPIDDDGEDSSAISGAIGAGIGAAMGFVMYFAIFFYGTMVMRSVQEEKTTRIVEVMISSVKPFELMLGKIVGVGLVGLTQLAIWAVLIPVVTTVATAAFGFEVPSAEAQMGASAGADIDPEVAESFVVQALAEVNAINWWALFPLFVLYFLGGYLLYASLFAAVGSAMGDDQGESQALTIPITIPVVLAIYIMFAAVRSPDSTLSLWASQFPLFSPIVMPARLTSEPAFWQVALSISILVATCIGTVWLAGRIYRTGILLYGKKIGFKEMGKWLRVG